MLVDDQKKVSVISKWTHSNYSIARGALASICNTTWSTSTEKLRFMNEYWIVLCGYFLFDSAVQSYYNVKSE